MSSPPANFFAKFSAFFLFPQVLHSCFGQAARIFCRFLTFFTKAIPPAVRRSGAGRHSGNAAAGSGARVLPLLPAPFSTLHRLWKTPVFLSVFALHSFRRFPRGNFVEFIKFSTIGVDFPQMMWYTIILRIPVERQVESLRKTVFHNLRSAEFACPADHGDPRRSCRTGFEVT